MLFDQYILQPELAHANEINRDILRANTLFLGKGSLEKIWLPFLVVYNFSCQLLNECSIIALSVVSTLFIKYIQVTPNFASLKSLTFKMTSSFTSDINVLKQTFYNIFFSNMCDSYHKRELMYLILCCNI